MALKNKQTFNHIYRILVTDQKEKYIHIICNAEYDNLGNKYKAYGIIQDVTDSKQNQKKLHLATKVSEIGIWVWDIPNNTLTWDGQMYKLYGVEENEKTPPFELWSNALIPSQREEKVQLIFDCLENKTNFDTTFTINTPNGEKIIKATAITSYALNGKPLEMIGTNQDITKEVHLIEKLKEQSKELKEKQQILEKNQVELEEAYEMANMHKDELEYINENLENEVNRITNENLRQMSLLQEQSKLAAMGEMIGAIAHNWRQPLNELSIRIQKIKYQHQNGVIDDKFIETFVEKNKKVIKFMSKTIDDFRNFFKQDKEQKNFTIKSTIEDVLNILSAQLKSHAIEIKIVGDDFTIFGNKSELEQAILNLISNAKDQLVEHNIQKPFITIRLDHNKFMIEDNGGGIIDSNMERIFEPYFTTKEQGKGTGLGLYMTKMIIESNYNASITVENIDHGARFIVTFYDNILETNTINSNE